MTYIEDLECDPMKSIPHKHDKDSRLTSDLDNKTFLDNLRETVSRLNRVTAYGITRDATESSTAHETDDVDFTTEKTDSLREPVPESDEKEYADFLQELNILKASIRDKPMVEILNRYLAAIERKHHAWFWQWNFTDASLQDKDNMWSDLQQADEEAALLTEELNERIVELLH
jgi:hypothetical protein